MLRGRSVDLSLDRSIGLVNRFRRPARHQCLLTRSGPTVVTNGDVAQLAEAGRLNRLQ